MTERKIRIGVSVRPQHTSYENMAETWQAAEAAGVDDIYIWDHFFPLFGDEDGTHFECFTLLASLATITSSARIGPLVACNSYRNPNLLADMSRTIDHISGGRFILGVGSGWKELDYDEYGYPFKTAPERLRDLRDNLPVIKERLAKLNPSAVQKPLPIMIGGSGEKVTLKLVAQYADMWNGFGSPEEAKRLSGILDEHCATVGRNPAEIERSIMVNGDTIMGQLDDYAAAGITTLILGISGEGEGLDRVKEMIVWRDSR
jgi:probable F420-dependent oxidoreductase